MSTPLIDREMTSRPASADVRPDSSPIEIPANVRTKRSRLTANAVSVPSRKPSETNLNFEMPTMVDKKGRVVSENALAARRQRRAWLGNALIAAVVYSTITLLTAGTSTLAARVRLESTRNEGINAINRSRAALASMDRRNQVGGTANGYLAGGELEQWATTVGFSDSPSTMVAEVAAPTIKRSVTLPSAAALVTSGPSVKVIRVAAR